LYDRYQKYQRGDKKQYYWFFTAHIATPNAQSRNKWSLVPGETF
jgi:hypothetical protein